MTMNLWKINPTAIILFLIQNILIFLLLFLGLQGLTVHLSNMWKPSRPGGLPSYKQWGTWRVGNVLDPARVHHPKPNFKLKSMCVTDFLPGHKLSKFCAAVKPSATLKQSSPLVMWVQYRKRPILPSLVSPSFTSPWTGINATPSLGSLHVQNVSMRTEMVLEG